MTEQIDQKGSSTGSDVHKAGGVTLRGVKAGVLGIKSGMTQIYSKVGDVVPVTVIELCPNRVTQVKTVDRDGYQSVQIGVLEKGAHRCNRPEKGHFKRSGHPGFYVQQEFRVDSLEGISEGAIVVADFLKEGALVDISAVSKGKGYQGGMKRFNMSGGFKTHGASLSHRSLGSIGNRADPAKCFKNKKMPGHMGSERVTIQNLEVIAVDAEAGVALIRGSVPGPKKGVVTIRKAIKSKGNG